MDVVVHTRKAENANCMFSEDVNGKNFHIFNNSETDIDIPLFQNVYFFTAQSILSSLINMLMDIAVLEFICSQSPYSMKGLVFGFFFLVKSLSQALVFVSTLPFGVSWRIHAISCGSGFYLTTVIIGTLELMLFSYVAKKFKHRIVNEPSNEYRYAEEYYSNIQ